VARPKNLTSGGSGKMPWSKPHKSQRGAVTNEASRGEKLAGMEEREWDGLSIDRAQDPAHRDLGISGNQHSGVPVAGVLRRFRWAAILSVIVLLECGVLAVNGGRCPLTDVAARYTVDRDSNFDIHLPNWVAEHNKVVFGWLFVLGELCVFWYWRGSTMKDALRAGVLYFLIVFATGFGWVQFARFGSLRN
jgi:hypothetical protein